MLLTENKTDRAIKLSGRRVSQPARTWAGSRDAGVGIDEIKSVMRARLALSSIVVRHRMQIPQSYPSRAAVKMTTLGKKIYIQRH
jgi:hypothetical protein